MKTVMVKGIPLFGTAALMLSGCNALIEGAGLGPDAMEKIIIINQTDVKSCESRVPPHKNSSILYYSHDKSCEDYGRTEGNDCRIITEHTSNRGDTTCVIGYDPL